MARDVLNSISEDNNEVDTIIGDIQKSISADSEEAFSALWTPRYRFMTILAFLFASFNQFTGINVFIYYAPRILEKTGMSTEEALWQTFIAIGITNLIATIGAMFAIDRFGRKGLMYVGSVGLVISLSLMAFGFSSPTFDKTLVLACLIGFIGSFAMSQGAVIWVFLSEIFPNQLRNHGQSLGSFTHWVWNFIISLSFPVAIGMYGGGIVFGFFAFMMVVQLLFVWKMMPETKGKTLEALEAELVRP